MPTFNHKKDFDGAYSTKVTHGTGPTRKRVQLHYHRYACRPHAASIAKRIVKSLHVKPDGNILIVGCGFGWLVEELMPYCNCVGTDTSAYIHANKDTSELPSLRTALNKAGINPDSREGMQLLHKLLDGGTRTHARILNEDSLDARSCAAVKKEFGGDIDYVFTEHVLTGMSEPQGLKLCNGLEMYGSKRVLHLLQTLQPHIRSDAWLTIRAESEWQYLLGNQQIFKEEQGV